MMTLPPPLTDILTGQLRLVANAADTLQAQCGTFGRNIRDVDPATALGTAAALVPLLMQAADLLGPILAAITDADRNDMSVDRAALAHTLVQELLRHRDLTNDAIAAISGRQTAGADVVAIRPNG
ncbi:MAG: hypothetical protein HY984_02300 [Candidatus Magasanikbacteria bacterium]|nr:hypothetical protein [Candidatus Magasanikbacteria bacterium]